MTILYICFILHFSLYSTQRGCLTWKSTGTWMWCADLVWSPIWHPKYNLYAFFTIGLMDFLCDFVVNSPQT